MNKNKGVQIDPNTDAKYKALQKDASKAKGYYTPSVLFLRWVFGFLTERKEDFITYIKEKND